MYGEIIMLKIKKKKISSEFFCHQLAMIKSWVLLQHYLVPTCTVFVQHERDPCFPYSAPIVFCSGALMSEFDLVDVDFLLLNFL